MRFTKAFLLSVLLALAIVGGLYFYVSSKPQPTQPPVTIYQPPDAHPSPTPAPAPTPSPTPAPAPTKTYTNAKYGFTVEYPESVVPTEDPSDMEMSGYIPVCDSGLTVACFPLNGAIYGKSNFEMAGFAVQHPIALKTKAICEGLQPESGETAEGSVTIGGVEFKKYLFGDAALGHQMSGEHYRAFKDGQCFQLVVSIGTTTYENYPAGTKVRFTDADRMDVQKVLDEMLMSVRFK